MEVSFHAFLSLYEELRLVVNLTLQQLDPLERALDTHWCHDSRTWGFLKVLSRIFLSWRNKLGGREVIGKIEYVCVHCVDTLSIMGFCEPCVL